MPIRSLILLSFAILMQGGFHVTILHGQERPFRHEQPVAMELPFTVLDTLPYSTSAGDTVWLEDFRHTDCSALDLRNRFELLLSCDFDSKTVWPPEKVPEYFRPEFITIFSANPGCTVRKAAMHGYTGKGRHIIIIGPPPLTGHAEYRHRLAEYLAIGRPGDTATVDGTAWLAIAAGKTSGAAFDATIHYIGVPHTTADGRPVYDSDALEDAIAESDSIIRRVPAGEEVTAVALPYDIDSTSGNWCALKAALQRLRGQNAAVFTAGPDYFGPETRILGLGRDPLRNPEDYLFWRPAQYWYDDFKTVLQDTAQTLWLPLDSRYLAAPTGVTEYAFTRAPSRRWMVPFLATCYTLAREARNGVTLEEFWRAAIATGVKVKFGAGEETYEMEHVLHLSALLQKLEQWK